MRYSHCDEPFKLGSELEQKESRFLPFCCQLMRTSVYRQRLAVAETGAYGFSYEVRGAEEDSLESHRSNLD